MAIDNLISVAFTIEELAKIEEAIKSMNSVLADRVVNLTPDERRQYGRIADKNKILVDKCKAYMEQNTDTVPRGIDKAEFDRDYAARQQLERPLRQLRQLVEKLQDTKTLLDHDNYTAAIAYYRYIKYLASTNEAGTTSIYQDLRSHYQTSSSSSASKEATE